MEYLKNIPLQPEELCRMIDVKPGQVVTMSLSKMDAFQIILYALSEGESISGEIFPVDSFYYQIEGDLNLKLPDTVYQLKPGMCLGVPAGVEHEVLESGNTKFLYIGVGKA